MARQKNQELRQEILKAAYQRFMRDDYNNILLKDIAADCGISVSLLHHYFPTKADIIINIILLFLLFLYAVVFIRILFRLLLLFH